MNEWTQGVKYRSIVQNSIVQNSKIYLSTNIINPNRRHPNIWNHQLFWIWPRNEWNDWRISHLAQLFKCLYSSRCVSYRYKNQCAAISRGNRDVFAFQGKVKI